MIETYTFISKGGCIQYTIKKDYLNICSNPETKDDVELFKDTNFFKSLHNEDGPAIVNLTFDDNDPLKYYYFVNGIPTEGK